MIETNIKTIKEKKIWINGFLDGVITTVFAIMSGIFFRNALKNVYNVETNLIIWIRIIGIGLGILFAILTLLKLRKLNNIFNKK
jgi:uncharacterized membrane protein